MSARRMVVAVVFALPVLALLAYGLSRNPNDRPSMLVGRMAPGFALEVMPRTNAGPESGTAGDTVRVSDFRGRPVVVNFWASWCLPCRDEHEPLSRVAERYRDRGVAFVGILYNDSPTRADRWIDEMGGQSYPTLLDPGSRTAIAYGLIGVPETFFIDATGRVAYKHIGPVDESILVREIEALLESPANGERS